LFSGCTGRFLTLDNRAYIDYNISTIEKENNMTVKIYSVGGAIRDEILGIKNKDIDFAVEANSYQEMKDYIVSSGGTIFLENLEYTTIRARMGKVSADYVLCRKDGIYSDGRHPDTVTIGTIYDDLARRDFTMNAIAKDQNGNYIDPFNGIKDIENKIIRCVGNTRDRINEDNLRLLRAARFYVTKEMLYTDEIEYLFGDRNLIESFRRSVSRDRVREELHKMFNCNTMWSIGFFGDHYDFASACFGDDIWLKATFEQR
jgi:tRNA nucleotidyltransferase (CCA-adding enzyme)